MRLLLFVLAIATTSSFCFAQGLPCVNHDARQFDYQGVKSFLGQLNDEEIIVCIYINELDGTLFARPLRNVLMMELLRDNNSFVLQDDVVAHQELQRRLSKEWILSQYYNPTWVPVRKPITADVADSGRLFDLVVESTLGQPADQPNVTFSVIE